MKQNNVQFLPERYADTDIETVFLHSTLLPTDCPSLWMVETVNKWKTAHVLDRHWGLGEREEPLRVLVQVNTSGEASQWVTSHHVVHVWVGVS